MKASLYIDPGVREHAVAYFRGHDLVGVSMTAREDFVKLDVRDVGVLVIEKPRVYPGPQEADANDLIDLAGAAYFVEGAVRANGGPAAQYVYPSDWKGQIKKPAHHFRVWDSLSLAERSTFARDIGTTIAAVTAKILEACEHYSQTRKVRRYSWKAHNALDAVGLGLWHTGRVGRAGHRFGARERG